jgi:DnaJ like chaperone protein
MDPFAWLGLGRARGAASQLRAIHARVKSLLPEDESVVHRYIVVVAVLLARVAQADGALRRGERDHLGVLFRDVDRMTPEGIDELCRTLEECVPRLTPADVELCCRELKSLCDAEERLQVLRLLTSQATLDGNVAPQEHDELARIASHLDVPNELVTQLEVDALTSNAPLVGSERAPDAEDETSRRP